MAGNGPTENIVAIRPAMEDRITGKRGVRHHVLDEGAITEHAVCLTGVVGGSLRSL
jgi:hypothetical protein